jgi:predicted permease
VASIGAAIARDVGRRPPDAELTLRLIPLQRTVTSAIREQVLVLWGAVVMLLVLGCVNVAGLMLAQSSSRMSEIATRIALGGGRAAILRQFLVESVVLAASGGIAGVALGYAIARGVSVKLEPYLALPVAPDLRVLLVSAIAALATSIVFGLLPAVQASRTDPRTLMTEGPGTRMTPLTRRWGARCLVIGEVAIGLVLVVGAGLLLRTVSSLTALRPGFDARGVVVGRVSLQDARYRTAETVHALFAQTLQEIRRSPGVEEAAVALTLPYERAMNRGWRRPGEARPRQTALNYTYVTPGYFRALRIPIKRGRIFDERDSSESPLVGVVNDAFVRRFAGDSDPLGTRLIFGEEPAVQIVGVVGDVQQAVTSGAYDIGPVAALPAVYVPAAQVSDDRFALAHMWFEPHWIVRAAGAQGSAVVAMREALRRADPALPFSAIRTLADVRRDAFRLNRMQASLLSALASIAVLLCAVGVYGLIGQSASARSRDFAIRVALGARQVTVVRAAMAPGVMLAAVGIGLGLTITISVAPVMRHFVFGLAVTDPATLVVAATIVMVTACAAALVPALRVRRISLVHALRGH